MEFVKYHDGQLVSEQDSQLINFMKTNGLFQQAGSLRVCFTGTINLNEKVYLFFPKGLKIEKDVDILESGRTLLGTIKKYVASGRGNKISFAVNENGVSGIPPVEALNLLQDYMRFGLYSNSHSELSKNPAGKIDWKKVISKHIPFITKGKPPIYTELVTRRTNYFFENDVTIVHKAILAKLDRAFGWYYSNKSIAPEFKKIKLPYSSKEAIAIVRKELSTVYSDREVRLLKNIITILSQNGLDTSSTEHYSGITNFQHVWEDICSEIYRNEKKRFSHLIPIPAYICDDQIIPERANSQIMDIIVEKAENIAILDAKYYNFAKGKPQWSDLVKQFYYKKSLDAVLPQKEIKNFFLAPEANSPNLPAKAIVINQDSIALSDTFPPINIIYLNVKNALDAYINKSQSRNYREELFTNYFDSSTIKGNE